MIGGKSVTFFNVTFAVLPKGRSWSVQKRYSDFDSLNNQLSVLYPGVPNLPGKSMFSITESAQLDTRKQGL